MGRAEGGAGSVCKQSFTAHDQIYVHALHMHIAVTVRYSATE